MRKCVNWVVIGMMLVGCQSTMEGTAVSSETSSASQEETASLRASFDECIERAAAITPKMQDCIGEEYVFQNARMQAALAKLQPVIADDQLVWLQRDETECPWDPETGGQAQRLNANFCSLERIARRAGELEAKLVR